jgi:fatty acid-binding protein DegV
LIGFPPAYVMDISTVVAMNAGIGTVAIAYIRKDQS